MWEGLMKLPLGAGKRSKKLAKNKNKKTKAERSLNILDLPTELITTIASYLSPVDAMSFKLTHPRFYGIVSAKLGAGSINHIKLMERLISRKSAWTNRWAKMLHRCYRCQRLLHYSYFELTWAEAKRGYSEIGRAGCGVNPYCLDCRDRKTHSSVYYMYHRALVVWRHEGNLAWFLDYLDVRSGCRKARRAIRETLRHLLSGQSITHSL